MCLGFCVRHGCSHCVRGGQPPCSNTWVTIHSAKAKTSTNALVRDPRVARLVAAVLLHYYANFPLWFAFSPFSRQHLPAAFKSACAALHLPATFVRVGHSLRHGAATRDLYDRELSVVTVLERGCLQLTKASRRYFRQRAPSSCNFLFWQIPLLSLIWGWICLGRCSLACRAAITRSGLRIFPRDCLRAAQ